MRKLFRTFERAGLEYLLISGQASILYGAATFSEDVDLWVQPTPSDFKRLAHALASRRARIHKLTPPLSLRYVRAGHGFHFVVPGGPLPIYVDVLGVPPRVGSYAESRRRARFMETDWGRIPVVSIEDLVELKKTRRLSDYEVISNLVSLRVSEESEPSVPILRWAAHNSFRAEDRVRFLAELGRSVPVERCREQIAREVAVLQSRDVRYWRRAVGELRRLRREGRLLPEGMPVAETRTHRRS